VLLGDLQPLSQLHNLAVFDWRLVDDAQQPPALEDWPEPMQQEVEQWSHNLGQAVQQWLAPSWAHLKYLHLDVDMDRATLQAVAIHCPQLKNLGCSTLAITQSHPQIQLSSLRTLMLTFNLDGGPGQGTPVPVSAFAALKAPALKDVGTRREMFGLANVGAELVPVHLSPGELMTTAFYCFVSMV
jgi:hypothetical protein